MKRFALLSGLFVLLISICIGCGFGAAAGEAEKYSDKFYDNLKNKDYDAIIDMLDEEALAASNEDEWRTVLKQKEQFGELEKVNKDIGFHTQVNNGVTTVTLNYTCDYEKGVFYEIIILVNRGEGYKVWSYEYNTNKNKLSS